MAQHTRQKRVVVRAGTRVLPGPPSSTYLDSVRDDNILEGEHLCHGAGQQLPPLLKPDRWGGREGRVLGLSYLPTRPTDQPPTGQKRCTADGPIWAPSPSPRGGLLHQQPQSGPDWLFARLPPGGRLLSLHGKHGLGGLRVEALRHSCGVRDRAGVRRAVLSREVGATPTASCHTAGAATSKPLVDVSHVAADSHTARPLPQRPSCFSL